MLSSLARQPNSVDGSSKVPIQSDPMARKEGRNYRCWRTAGQARLAFLCALGLFIGGQIALEAAIHIWWPELHDWDFGVKLRILRASIAEKRAGQPVVVVLGSSRAALGV